MPNEAPTAQQILDMLNPRVDMPAPPTMPEGIPAVGAIPATQKSAQDIMQALSDVDEGVDYGGIPSAPFRAGYSRMDTEDEREKFLQDNVGAENYDTDSFGRYVISPAGMERLGIPGRTEPTTIEDKGLSWYDLADMRGDIPAVAGGAGAGMAATGLGVVPGMLLAGAGAGLGKAIDEIADHYRGENLQTFGEVATDVAAETALGAAGELGFRAILAPAGRKLMAPEASRMTDEAAALVEEAKSMGASIKSWQATKAPILGRVQGMMDNIFGDPHLVKNSQVFKGEVERMRTGMGPDGVPADAGSSVKVAIMNARRAVTEWADAASKNIDREIAAKTLVPDDAVLPAGWEVVGPVGDQRMAVVPTQRLKDAAVKIIEDYPSSTKSGDPLFINATLVKELKRVVDELPDHVTISQMQKVTNTLWDDIGKNKGVFEGITEFDAKSLWGAATDSYDDIADPSVRDLVKTFRSQYKNRIKEFDNAFIQRLVKDESAAGYIPPEKVTSLLFRRGQHTNLEAVMKKLPPDVKAKVRVQAFDDLMQSFLSRSSDPAEGLLYNGKKLLTNMDKYGRPTLEAMFGKSKTNDLYRLGRVNQFVTQKLGMAGGLVAANIALHPIRNVGKLVQLRLLSKFFDSDTGLRYLTTGLKAPKTRAGASALARTAVQLQMLVDEEMQRVEQ